MIDVRAPGIDAVPPKVWPENEPGWEKSHTLWNQQQTFDERLHNDRGLLYPQDVTGATKAANQRQWLLGMTFAFLEELDELIEAKELQNPDEETVDTLHFTLSLACKLDMTPQELGRFEDVFATAKAAATEKTWDAELDAVLADYVRALGRLKGAHHKWWKNQPEMPDWSAQHDALREIHHLNLRVASHVFADAEAMYNKYMGKVAENHQRQEGTVAGREDYISTQ